MVGYTDGEAIARIGYVELTEVGQAFQLGRHPIYFSHAGNVHDSFVRGCSIHTSYNRAIAMNNVNYLKVQWNLVYDIMGHAFFFENAIEEHNLLENNIGIMIQKSWSLLNTDQTPATFWISHPNNIFRGNHAAGSDSYGFWYDL